MSVLQEYQEIRYSLGEKNFSHIEKFLKSHPKYDLKDVYYRSEIWREFEKWLNRDSL